MTSAPPTSATTSFYDKPPLWWSFWYRVVVVWCMAQGPQEGGGGPYWPFGLLFRWTFTVQDWLFAKSSGAHRGFYDFQHMLARTALAVIIATIWLAVQYRRKRERETFEIGWLLGRLTYTQLLLGMGLIKLFPLQMLVPAGHLMMMPFGDVMWGARTWHLIGPSTVYQYFTGIVECTVALLLVFRRTAILGSVLVTFVLVTITAISSGSINPMSDHYMPMSGVPLWGAFGLLTLVIVPVSKFFVLNRPVQLSTEPDHRWLRITERVLQVAFIGAGIHGVGHNLILPDWPEQGRKAPIAGVYEVIDVTSTDTTAARQWLWVSIEDRFSTRIGVHQSDCYTVAIRTVEDSILVYSDPDPQKTYSRYSPHHQSCVESLKAPQGALHGERRAASRDFYSEAPGGPLTLNYRRTTPQDLEVTAFVDQDTVWARLRRIPMPIREGN
jgi:hypothetical protein